MLVLNRVIIFLIVSFLLIGCSKKNIKKEYSNSNNKTITQNNNKIRNSKAMHRATMKSYFVLGNRYYPKKTYVGEEFEGIASWYGPDFHAKKTSNGETYNMYAQTAASKTLPMNTMVKVYNKDNGKSTIVRINDRGPFVRGRIIDLSNKAAHDIDMVANGTANILLTVVGQNAKLASQNNDIIQTKEESIRGNYFLQVGAYSKIEGAKKVKRQYNELLDLPYKAVIKQTMSNGLIINKVLISGFNTEEEADEFRNNNDIIDAVIISI